MNMLLNSNSESLTEGALKKKKKVEMLYEVALDIAGIIQTK